MSEVFVPASFPMRPANVLKTFPSMFPSETSDSLVLSANSLNTNSVSKFPSSFFPCQYLRYAITFPLFLNDDYIDFLNTPNIFFIDSSLSFSVTSLMSYPALSSTTSPRMSADSSPKKSILAQTTSFVFILFKSIF